MAIREIEYKGISYPISYEIKNPTAKINAIFLHGWGSNREVSKSGFANFLSDFKHIYIDMPGFGKSPNSEVLTTQDYAQIMKIFLKDMSISHDIILAHSFGGKVATILEPKLLVLLSSAGIVPKKSLKVRLKIKLFKTLKTLGLGKFYKLFASKDVDGMSKNMYETFKNVVDEKFDDIFKSYEGKALLFWGKADSATPLSSGEKMHTLIKNSKFFPIEGDHYFFLKPENGKFISDTIQREIDGLF